MKHWLWYKTTGEIGGHSTTTGGFDEGVTDPNDAGTADPTALFIRQAKDDRPGDYPNFKGWILYDCACDPAESLCDCADNKRHAGRVDTPLTTPTLADKPTDHAVEVDGVAAAENTHDAPIDVTPGADVTIRLICPSIPDGESVELHPTRGGAAHMHATFPAPVTVSVTAGASAVITLKAPAQGLTGGVSFYDPKWCKPMYFFFRGWAA